MDSSRFCYERNEESIRESEVGAFPGLLDIYVHHARNIHNICIYAKQDVYAKFSLTCTPDDAISTRIVAGGGKNPQFDERLTIKVPHADTVLKCEIWMLSRVRNYLEDQLLGFALVPLSSVISSGKGKLSQDFTLSSTDLFHSPAGTVQLTLTLHASSDKHSFAADSSTPNSSITSEVVILDPAEIGRIEFPDIGIAKENQKMVSEYFDMTATPAPFLQLGASSQPMEDYEMTVNSSDDNSRESNSPDGSIQNSGPFTSSTTTSLSDDRNSADSAEKNNRQDISNKSDTPTSKCGNEKENKISNDKEEEGSVFESPMGNINFEAEQNAMQQQIVDMYMRSMQQFTESLAKMKLPMNLDVPKAEDGGDVIQSQKDSEKLQQQKKKKDGARVFYGSRAFF
ncbi:uncharacterized protein LOC109850111 [Asparagus officinalis]|uniref:uncharacterized protein LOC109850111 n=1 Tax=Asparagus officinalis TaxID=4686 RepID=UPI00098E0FB4|nr:uncharacterized protein LOC109850111 [Asparagus officinalis]